MPRYFRKNARVLWYQFSLPLAAVTLPPGRPFSGCQQQHANTPLPTHIGTTAIIHAAMYTACPSWSTPEDISSVGSDRLRLAPRPHLQY